MGVRETKRVFQIKVALSVEVESGSLGLIDAPVDRDQYGLGADLAWGEVSAETTVSGQPPIGMRKIGEPTRRTCRGRSARTPEV